MLAHRAKADQKTQRKRTDQGNKEQFQRLHKALIEGAEYNGKLLTKHMPEGYKGIQKFTHKSFLPSYSLKAEKFRLLCFYAH